MNHAWPVRIALDKDAPVNRAETAVAQRGFSYIEMVVVIIVIGLIAVGAMSKSPGLSIETRPEAMQLASDLRYAQILSMSQGQDYCLTFSGSSYLLSTAASGCQTAVANSGASVAPTSLRDATLSVSGLPNNLVAFDGLGAPYESVGAMPTALAGNAVLTLIIKGVSETITLSPTTGLVTVTP